MGASATVTCHSRNPEIAVKRQLVGKQLMNSIGCFPALNLYRSYQFNSLLLSTSLEYRLRRYIIRLTSSTALPIELIIHFYLPVGCRIDFWATDTLFQEFQYCFHQIQALTYQ